MMVNLAQIFNVSVLLASVAVARPSRPAIREDSAVGEEVAVSAPNGIVLSDTSELAKQTATAPTGVTPPNAEATLMPNEKNSWNQGASDPQPKLTETTPPATTTTTTYATTTTYGSGKSNWDGSQYDDCMKQCVAKYAPPPTMLYTGNQPAATPTTTPSPDSQATTTTLATATAGSGGSCTHTVVVAPTQGVLRYVPFVVNASVGDTVLFRWGANTHTVTKSSALFPCNITADAPFTSGVQSKGFEYTQLVNTTETTFFFCNVPTHCQKGMFGAINAPSSFGSPTSVAVAAGDMAAKNPEMAAAWGKATQNNTKAAAWGSNLDMKDVPEWAQPNFIESVMYTRAFLAANPETLKADGSVDLSVASTSPLQFPEDPSLAGFVAPTSDPLAPAPSANEPSVEPTTAPAPGAAAPLNSGAQSLTVTRILAVATMSALIALA